MAQYYLGDPVIRVLSYAARDPAWIPRGTPIGPALGVHYFGDFEQYMGYALSRIPPYSPRLPVHPAYGPAAIVLAKVLHWLFGWPGAVLAFLGASLVAFVASLVALLGRSVSSLLLAGLLSCSGAVVMALDRGNYEVLVAALCALAAAALLRDRPWLAAAALTGAISLKAYTAILLLAFVWARRWRPVVATCALTLVVYLVSFLVLGGSITTSIGEFFRTDLHFASSPSHGFVLGCVSAAAAVYKTLWLFWSQAHFFRFLAHSPTWYLQVPGLVAAGGCLGVLAATRRNLELALLACFAMMQLVPDAAYPYTQVSVVLELCLLVRLLASGEDLAARRSLVVAAGLLVVGSAPWVFMLTGPSGNTTPLFAYLGPWCNLSAVGVVLAGQLAAARRRWIEAGRPPVLASARLGRVAPSSPHQAE